MAAFRSRNKRLFTMNIPPASLPRLLPVWAGLLLAAFSGNSDGLRLYSGRLERVRMDRIPAFADSPVVRPQTEGKGGILAYALYGWVFGVVFYGISFWWVNEVSTLGYIPPDDFLWRPVSRPLGSGHGSVLPSGRPAAA